MNNNQEEKLKIQIDDFILNMKFKDLLHTYFKDTHPFLNRISIKEIDSGFVFNEDESLLARMETYQYHCFNEDSNKDLLIISDTIKNIFNNLEEKAKYIFNPLYSEMNIIFIREEINYQCFINQITKRRCILVMGRFGFYNILTNNDCKTVKTEDGQEVPL
jgi:hypothetical protein